jgi:hypothetical protein
MDHDEKWTVISYYILGMIPSRTLELKHRQCQVAASSTVLSNAIIVSLPNTTVVNRTTDVSVSGKHRNKDDIIDRHDNHHVRSNYEIDTESTVPWVVDEWTVRDEQEASTILEGQMEQCRITDQEYKTKKFRINDTMAWNRFYQSHQSNFFKDRHYFVKEFPEEFTLSVDDTSTTLTTSRTHVHQRCLVEIGCGVGNAMLPLLGSDRCTDTGTEGTVLHKVDQLHPIQWTVYGFDLSSTAIDILRNDVRYQQALKLNRTYCDVCDISIPNALPSYVQNVANVTSLIFCLSAIHPSKHSIVLQNVTSTLQPGNGILIFRDYGRYDLAQIKLGTQRSKLLDVDNFYRKHDGTKCYYFTMEDIEDLIQQQNGALEILELRYIRRKYINRSLQCERRRVWVQGRFRRTVDTSNHHQSQRDSRHSDVVGY